MSKCFYIIKEKTTLSLERLGSASAMTGISAGISRTGVRARTLHTERSMCRVLKEGEGMARSRLWKWRALQSSVQTKRRVMLDETGETGNARSHRPPRAMDRTGGFIPKDIASPLGVLSEREKRPSSSFFK